MRTLGQKRKETTAPRVLKDGRPSRTLYDVGASTTRKRIGVVLV